MKLRRLLGNAFLEFRESLQRRGVGQTLRLSVLAVARIVRGALPMGDTRDEFDRTFGVDTARRVSLLGLDIDGPNRHQGVDYQATPVRLFREMMSALPANDLANYTLVDYGCGKGRVLLLASEYGFKRIVGVEFSKELASIAQQNLQRFGSTADVVCGDASEFILPEGPLVLYLYNPFGGPVLEAVMRHARCAAARSPVLVIYHNPLHRDLVEGAGFEPVACSTDWVVYRFKGASDGPSLAAT